MASAISLVCSTGLEKYKRFNQSTNQSINQQAVVRGTTNPAPVLECCQRPKTAISLHSQSLGGSTGLPEDHRPQSNQVAMAGDNKQLDLRPADPFTRIDPKSNEVVPWTLHTFPENFMQIGPAVFS